MKYIIGAVLLVASIVGGYSYFTQSNGVGGGLGTIEQLGQWFFDGTNITQNTANTPIKLTGYESAGDCLVTDTNGIVSTATCGDGGGGSSKWKQVGGFLQPLVAYVTNGIKASYFVASSSVATSTFPNIKAGNITANTSAGLDLDSNNGTHIANLGVGSSANSVFYGGVNIDGQIRLATSLTGLGYLTSGVVSATNSPTVGFINATSGTSTFAQAVAIGTTTATHALTFPLNSSGIALYNTAVQSTNYLRGVMNWNSGNLYIGSENSGSVAGASTYITSAQTNGTAQGQMIFTSNSVPRLSFVVPATNAVTGIWYNFTGQSNNSSVSPAMTLLGVRPTINQTGSAGYTALSVIPIETSTGTGTKLLIQAGTSTNQSMFVVNNAGDVGIGSTTPSGTLSIEATGTRTHFMVGSSFKNMFNIVNNGKVGIGTSSPVTELSIVGTTTTQGLRIYGLPGTRALFLDAEGNATTTADSAYLASALSDETGTGVAVFGTSPTFTTQITAPVVKGGTGVASTLILEGTSGVGTSDAIIFRSGNILERGRISTNGSWSIGTTSSSSLVTIASTTGTALLVRGTSTFDGGVGIGSSTPSARFSLVGIASTTIAMIVNSIGTRLISIIDNTITALGIWDFSGATKFIPPTGTAPVVDSIGALALDTTDNQILVATSTDANSPAVIPTTMSIGSFLISSTSQPFTSGFTSGVSIPFKMQRDGYKVTEIYCDVDGGTSINISFNNGTGDTSTTTCGLSGTSLINVGANAIVTAGSPTTTIKVGTVTGAVNFLRVSVFGTYTRE